MKKVLAVFLALVLVLGFAACGKPKSGAMGGARSIPRLTDRRWILPPYSSDCASCE